MYSTRLDKNRYNITCLAVLDKVNMLELCVDTGAKYTCCSYNDINDNLLERDFRDCDFKYFGGFIEGTSMKFYRYHLKQFTIGNIDMKEQDIWVTFDKRVNEAVLGMDILSQITFVGIENSEELFFFQGINEFKEYMKILCTNKNSETNKSPY